MLVKTEGAINSGQYKDIGHIRQKIQNEDKDTTQKTKKMSKDPPK
jgi:hypothetical protein